MSEKSISELPRATRELYEKGNAALQKKNFDYALAIYNQVLQNEPGFYQAREALRATQFQKVGSGGGFLKKLFGNASSSPQLAKAQFALRNNPGEAMQACEQILNNDPNHTLAHKLLAEAAMNGGFARTAVLSLEIAAKNNPGDVEIARRLAEALSAAGQASRAEAIYSELLKANPNDPDLNQALKNVSAQRTMKEGGYESLQSGTGSYRDILRDKEQAVTLEQEQRTVKTGSEGTSLLDDYKRRLEKSPDDRRLLRSIAELHEGRQELDAALEYYRRLATLDAASTDPAIERAMDELELRKLELAATQLNPAEENFESRKAELEKQRQELQIEHARRRVARYPNDLQLHFELGVLYFSAGRIGEAIQSFQKAQAHPGRKTQALYYLGRSFAQRGMNDLAVRTLQNALKEKPAFDDEKKEIVYALAGVLEKMGKRDEAIEQYKLIYEVDIGYQNVAQKVDEYYSQQT